LVWYRAYNEPNNPTYINPLFITEKLQNVPRIMKYVYIYNALQNVLKTTEYYVPVNRVVVLKTPTSEKFISHP